MKRSSICDEKREAIMTLLLAIIGCLLHVSNAAVYAPSGGPVYVNPASTPSVAVATSPDHADGGELLTQTVYGFLDFTTTIGNTVMVFSPQSAPPDGAAAPKPTTTSNSVIETRPAASTSVEIKPSKTTVKKSDTQQQQQHKAAKPTVVLSSVVEVKTGGVATTAAEPSVSSVVEVLSSKVEVREGPVSVSKVKKAHTTVKAEGVSSVVQVKTAQASSRVEVNTATSIVSSIVEVHTKASPVVSSKVEVHTSPPLVLSTLDPVPGIISSIVEVRASNEEPALSGNNIVLEPEYDFLSRQPSEVVDETYKVFNLKPSARFPKPRTSKPPSDSLHPTGLVTKLGGTVVKDGVTTVHETKVLGTFISGKYAQVLESTSHVFQHGNHKPKPTPASSLRILKTASPGKHKTAPALEPTPAGSLHEETVALPLEALFSSAPTSNHVRPSRRLAASSPRTNSFQSRFRGRHNKDTQENREQELEEEEEEEVAVVTRKSSPARNVRPTASAQRHKPSPKNSRFGRTSTATPELATVSVFSDPVSSRRYQQPSTRSRNFRPATTSSNTPEAPSYTRRGYKPRVQASSADSSSSSTSLYKFKLARPPGRWQYKTTPKPRIAIRKPDEPETPTPQPEAKSRSDELEQQQQDQPISDPEVTQAEEAEVDVDAQPVLAETIKVEISTPADFKDVYYEIATIKSPYTFQVGTVKNTRYITVTSTYERNLESVEASISPTSTEPLTENILATTLDSHIPLDSSVATLPPIGLANDVETPPLETLTETFSTTQLLLKTHLLPVVRAGTNTSTLTLVQSYHVTRMVTAIKTLPPMELYHFVPSRTLNEFNTRLEEAGSELHLELDFGDETNEEIEDLATIEKHFDPGQVEKVKVAEVTTPRPMLLLPPPEPPTTPGLSPEQLALLRFLNPAAIPSVITTSRPVLKIETIYESHVLPVVNGLSTTFSTISRPVGTVSKTEYEYGTSTLAANPLFPPHQQQQQQQQFAVTSTPVVTQTVVTATESKVLKLTFGAKTAYTTLFSTKVVPTLLTTYLTASVPVQPTAPAFPGFYPQPYPPFPYVG